MKTGTQWKPGIGVARRAPTKKIESIKLNAIWLTLSMLHPTCCPRVKLQQVTCLTSVSSECLSSLILLLGLCGMLYFVTSLPAYHYASTNIHDTHVQWRHCETSK
jgi:hypothetical protein